MIACLRPLSLTLLATSALFLTACTSQRVADEASIAEAKKVMVPTMGAETHFFDGAFLVEANLGRGFRPRMVKPGFKGRATDNAFATVIYSDEAAREIAEEEEEGMFIPRMRNSTLPPVALRLRVYNLTAAPAELEFIECKSYLGNFAVRPEKITIPAGESGQPDPMVSLLGVSGEEIPVTITLRLGGKRETHTVVLVPLKAASKPPAPAAP
ncbi:hypothetical protein CMV30_04085 [Nibricoccus aquaticus]|uniref:Uncharacterized protein n=1 Tax=Nibricoccus aquaticus TaxID=2576891 RepID=A0A290QCZ6_9BACT|nr:hypothetical protein [Nibricoccus aquaticus]ATC63198.1 hypothetical protein CMV30_04085 [Nibricoccus aquaticus]